MSDWTDRDYGREDGAADFNSGRIDNGTFTEQSDYGAGYREGYDAALAKSAPDNVRATS